MHAHPVARIYHTHCKIIIIKKNLVNNDTLIYCTVSILWLLWLRTIQTRTQHVYVFQQLIKYLQHTVHSDDKSINTHCKGVFSNCFKVSFKVKISDKLMKIIMHDTHIYIVNRTVLESTCTRFIIRWQYG